MHRWSGAARQTALHGCRAGSGLPQVPVHTWWSAAVGCQAGGPWQRDEAPVAAVLPGAALDQHDGRLLAHLQLQQGGGLQERDHRCASGACMRGRLPHACCRLPACAGQGPLSCWALLAVPLPAACCCQGIQWVMPACVTCQHVCLVTQVRYKTRIQMEAPHASCRPSGAPCWLGRQQASSRAQPPPRWKRCVCRR